jgi:hypothetical protein
MPRATFVCNSKGGVGKTTVAVAIAEVYRALHGRAPKMIDCDSRHKLCKMLGSEVIGFGLCATTDDLLANPDLIVSYWDALGDHILGGNDVVIDLGANVDAQIFEWAARSRIADYLGETGVDIVVPTTAEPLAIEGARVLLTSAARIFPDSRRVLVLNEAHGRFAGYETADEFRSLLALPGLHVVRLPKCISSLWNDLERDGVSFAKAIELGPEKIGATLGLSRPWVAARALGDLARWGEAVRAAFQPLYH